MKLKKIIDKLKEISENVDPNEADVRMPDNLEVMNIHLYGNVIYITDVAKNGSTKKCREIEKH